MEYIEVTAKTLNDAITEACQKLGVPSSEMTYEVIEEGSAGFLGIGAKPVVIRAAKKEEEVKEEVPAKAQTSGKKDAPKKETQKPVSSEKKPEQKSAPAREKKSSRPVDGAAVEAAARKFLEDVFKAMDMKVELKVTFRQEENGLDVEMNGDDMGVLIGKRGQTLDSLQYLVSLVVNKDTDEYIRVKVDTENYRERRRETLENLAKNIAYKVKRTKRPVSLEPMNPYERRIIHSALQNDRYVTTYSEGEEPFRRVVVTLKR